MAPNSEFMIGSGGVGEAGKRLMYAGLVLHLDPRILLDRGAAHDEGAIEGPHFFVCVWVDEPLDETFWIPTSSKRGRNRCEIPPELKTGHPGWVRPCSYAVASQLWMAGSGAIRDAAYLDGSRETAPNRVTPGGLERLRQAVQ